LLPFVNVYGPAEEPGSLTVQKEVVGESPDPAKEFTFEITFTGEDAPASPQSFTLKTGEQKVFENIPNGVTYTVKETNAAGYLATVEEISGAIASGQNPLILFKNRAPNEPEEPITLSVTKQLAGEYPKADENKEFHFTLLVDGVETAFTLKPSETKEFEIPAGTSYEVWEDDYFTDGYALIWETDTNFSGQTIITATNIFVGEVQRETRRRGAADMTKAVESITIRLKMGLC
ncbi:MAG: DUF5979 domain-containing protein, partial [Clostridia bacterium]